MPTSPTTGATHRSSGLAPVSSTAEPPPPTLSGAPLLPEIPQSSYPPHRVALATIPDPPHRRPTSTSNRPPPPYSGRRSLPCLRVSRANAGTGPRARAGPARPWAACAMQIGRIGTVDVGCTSTVQLGRGGFGPVTVELIFLFSEYIQILVNSKICVGFI
jgi:hypothetical protein